MDRAKLDLPTGPPPPPLEKDKQPPTFFPTGSTLLDLALGGGWALGRVFNIVGDKSTGKTLLAIEAFANFIRKFPKGRMRYAEAEAAFDEVFADQLGFPSTVERPEEPIHTVEDFKADYYKFIEAGGPGLYVLDSLDALSDEAEIKKFESSLKKPEKKKAIDGEENGDEEPKITGSYGVAKAKEMSKIFRLLSQDAEKSDCSLGIISQIRDNIGVRFGETKTRSGGRALDFYASQVLWLAETGKNTKTANNSTRAVGVNIHSKVKKLKVGFPFREADYDILFGYGIDDESSMLDWLTELKAMDSEAGKVLRKQLQDGRNKQDYPALKQISNNLKTDCINLWKEIEQKLQPPIRKYQDA